MPLSFVVLEAVFNPDWVKYGIEGAIFLVGLIVLMFLVRHYQKEQQASKESLAAWQRAQEEAMAARQKEQDERAKQQDERLMNTLNALMKGQSHTHSQEEERSTSKFEGFVRMELDKLVKEAKCTRAYFVIYHNGAWSNNGISLPKMSIVNESVCAYGTESIMPQLQSIPRGFLPGIDPLFEKEGRVQYRSIEDFRYVDPMSYSWFSSHGCKSMCLFPVKDVTKDYAIGFVAVEYNGEVPEGLTDKQIRVATARVADGIAAAAVFTNEDEKMANGKKTALKEDRQ